MILYRTFSRKLSLFWRIFCCKIVLIAFHLSRGIFQLGFFWKKKSNGLGGCLKTLRLLSFCQTISGGFCRNYTLHVRSIIPKKTVIFGKKQLLRDFDNKRRYCGSVVESFSLRFKQLYATFPEEQFEWKLFSDFFEICIGIWAESVSAFWLEPLERVVTTVFYVSRWTFGEKIFGPKFFSSLSDIEKKSSSLPSKLFWRGCQYCFLPLQRIILKIFVKKSCFVNQFRTMSKKGWGFC